VFYILVLFIVSVLTPLKTYAAGTLVSDALGLEAGNLDAYFTNLFNLALVIGAVLAVLIIATAGLQYMTTDAISGKGESKDRIWQAVLGLLMLLSVYLFFKEINPNILNLDLKLDTVEVTGSSLDTRSEGTPESLATSRADFNRRTLDAEVDTVISRGNFGTIIQEHSTESSEWRNTPIGEREALKERWANDCEETESGEETGNTFKEVTVSGIGSRFLCTSTPS